MSNASSANRYAVIVHVFAKTDVGKTRDHNEDAFVVADLTAMNASLDPSVMRHESGDRGSLFMVADGMGGAAAGEIASAMATETVLRELDARWRRVEAPTIETFARAIKIAAEAANARIHRYAMDHPEYRGMGTTATIAGLLGDTLYLAQVGDSRAYLVRHGVAHQLTKDQSLMQKLVEAGELTQEEADQSERRNIILQALGPEPVVKVDLTHQRVRRGDVLVLCSDGLSGQIRTEDIANVVRETPQLEEVCSTLIDLANANGGPDNITVIAVRFEGPGLAAVSSADDVGHRVYTSEEDRRPTLVMDAAELPLADVAELDEVTDEVEAVPAAPSSARAQRMSPAGGGFAGGAPVRVSAASGGAEGTEREPRISPQTLRLIFWAIGLVVAAAVLYRWLRSREG